jgi:N-acetylglucosaminyl-diphospho-decaprenol L-rhamnosyltransferase
MITASIVSHGHGIMVRGLVEDLLGCPEVARVVVTQNVSEKTEYPEDGRVEVIRNTQQQGYGANQNAAFASASSPFFCVLNPDIRLKENPFPALLTVLQDAKVAASAPVIVTPENDIEDSARRFPTAMSLVGKALGLSDGTYLDIAGTQNPDWLAGMFLLFRSSAFREVGGFDEKYFLYYEDVDLGWRLRRRGYELRQVQEVRAVHAARRASRRDWQHAQWHLASMARFLLRQSRG